MIAHLRLPGVLGSLNWISLLWVSSLLSGFFAFLAQVLIARSFPVSDYGAFSAAYRLVSLLAPVAGFGVGACWLRLFGKEGSAARRWIRPSLILVSCTSLLAAGIALVVGAVAGPSERTAGLTYLLTPLLLFWGFSELGKAAFQLEGRYGALAFWESAFGLGCFLVAGLAWLGGWSVHLLATGLSLLGLAIASFHGRRVLQMTSARPGAASEAFQAPAPGARECAPPDPRDVAREAWSFALGGVFYLVYYQAGIVLVAWMEGAEAAGIYNAALTAAAAVYLLPDAVFQKFLMPKIQRWAEHDRERFIRVYRFGNGAMLASGLVWMLGLGLGGLTVLPWVFGAAYQESGRVLLILALCVPVRFLGVSVGSALVTGGHMPKKNRYHGIGALANVVLNVVLIPGLGVYGAAWSAVLTEAILLLLFLHGVRSHVLGSCALQDWNVRLESLRGS